MGHRLQPADHRQQPRTEDRSLQLGTIGQVDVAGGILVNSQSMFPHMNGRVGKFNMLNDLKLAGWPQTEPLHLLVIDLIVDRLIHPFRRQRLAEGTLVSRLSPPWTFPPACPLCLSCFPTGDIARWRLGGSRGILLRLGKFQLQLRNTCLQLRNPCRLLLDQRRLSGDKCPKLFDDSIFAVHGGKIAKPLK